MVAKRARKSDPHNMEVCRYDEELRANPPVLVWRTLPRSGGIQVAVYVYDPVGISDRKPRTQCGCNLYGRPKRSYGPHHDETCDRHVEAA